MFLDLSSNLNIYMKNELPEFKHICTLFLYKVKVEYVIDFFVVPGVT